MHHNGIYCIRLEEEEYIHYSYHFSVKLSPFSQERPTSLRFGLLAVWFACTHDASNVEPHLLTIHGSMTHSIGRLAGSCQTILTQLTLKELQQIQPLPAAGTPDSGASSTCTIH